MTAPAIPAAALEAAIEAFHATAWDAEPGPFAAALAAYERATWQPIETAPRTGESVIVYNDGEQRVAGWMTAIEDGSGEWIIFRKVTGGPDAMAVLFNNPTHWRPLPLAPVTP